MHTVSIGIVVESQQLSILNMDLHPIEKTL